MLQLKKLFQHLSNKTVGKFLFVLSGGYLLGILLVVVAPNNFPSVASQSLALRALCPVAFGILGLLFYRRKNEKVI